MSVLAAIPYDLFMFGPWEIYGPLKIQSFGLLVAIGLLLAFTMASRRGEREFGISGEEFQNFGMYLVVIGWISSHVLNIVFYEPEKILEDPLILFKVWGSISSYGGFIGGVLAAFIYRWRHPEKNFNELVDLAAYALTFAWMFGRFGCASVHDHPGSTTDFFLGVQWTDGTIRHDLGLYEAIWWMIIVAAVLIADRKPKPVGFFPALIATMYAPARFFLDFLRVPPEAGGDARYLDLTPAQYLSVGLFALGLYFWFRIKDQPAAVWRAYVHNSAKADSKSADSSKPDSK